MTYSILKKIHDQNTDGCAAIGVFLGKKYFAINGLGKEDPESKFTKYIRDVCGEEMEFIGADYAYSYTKPQLVENAYPPNYYKFFNKLNNKRTARIMIPTVQRIIYDNVKYGKFPIRFWSCAEKKLFSFQYNMHDVYITKRPCYYCLPIISNCYYLTEKKKHIARLKAGKNNAKVFSEQINIFAFTNR